MISWIQRSFQNHFKLIFAVILGATIFTFVVEIGATPGIGRAERRNVRRDFFGHNLGSPADMDQVMHDGMISAELQGGNLDEDRLKEYALQRIAALSLAKQLRLPAATPSELEGFIRNLPAFADQKGQFDAARYDQFRRNPEQFFGVSGDEIAHVLADDIRIDRVERLIDGPGYVLPADVRDQIQRSDTSWTLGVATVDYASYHPAINPSDAELAKYFQANIERYTVPPRVHADYIDFAAQAYVGQVQVSDAEVRAYYDAHAAKYDQPQPAPKAGAKAPPAPSADAKFAAAKAQAASDLRLEKARRLAAKDASDLAYALYQDKVPASGLAAYLASRHLGLKPLAPFTQQAGPAELGGSQEISEAAFKLTADRYYSDALPAPDGYVILVWQSTDSARQPALAEVRAKVLADYRENQKRADFAGLGSTLRADLQARLKAGAKFDAAAQAAAAQAGVKVDAKVLPPFTLESRPAAVEEPVLAPLDHLDAGQVAPMEIDGDKGYLVYAEAKKAPDPKTDAPRAAEVRRQLALYASRGAAIAYFSDLVNQELKRTDDTTKAQ
ncbi:MAG TPA: peptidyl-prolyl cis-trans isomerase [Opitutaceae bacterium]|nr:peptidyl-prolyl cis-trans isomerase [Opitutaceae bacterium]